MSLRSSSCVTGRQQIVAFNFDWDGNLAFMTTPVFLFHKKTGKAWALSAADFAKVQGRLGTQGVFNGHNLADYEMRGHKYSDEIRTLEGETLAYFYDDPTGQRDSFKEDLLHAMAESPDAWQGPSFAAFVQAMSDPLTAANTTLITARGNSPHQIRKALHCLQEMGLIRYVPPEENILPVSYSPLAARWGFVEAHVAKAQAILENLDQKQAIPLGPDALSVVDPEGLYERPMHLWGFSDDDPLNFDAVVSTLREALKANPERWSNVKITIFFTGENHPNRPPGAVILGPGGSVRQARARDLNESERLLQKPLELTAGPSNAA